MISPHSPDGHAVNDNAQTLPKAFRDAGWQVSRVRHSAIHRAPDGLAGDSESLANYDLIWPVGFGPRRGFFDWLQLMSELPTRQLINAPAALALKHGKAAWGAYSARHFIAAEAQTLIDVMQAEPGHWVLKPLAGSFGEAVIHLQSNETEAVASEMQKRPGEYFMLQRFLPEIALGETRTLVVAGRIIGSYLRIPTNQLHANLAQHGEPGHRPRPRRIDTRKAYCRRVVNSTYRVCGHRHGGRHTHGSEHRQPGGAWHPKPTLWPRLWPSRR